MCSKYTLETTLDTLPIAELKRLSLLAIKSQMKSRVKTQRYYEKHGENCRERTIQNYTLKKPYGKMNSLHNLLMMMKISILPNKNFKT